MRTEGAAAPPSSRGHLTRGLPEQLSPGTHQPASCLVEKQTQPCDNEGTLPLFSTESERRFKAFEMPPGAGY